MSETLYDLLKQTQAVKRVLGETAMTKPRAVQDVLVSPQLRSRMRLVIKDAESREHEFGGFLVGHYDGKDLRLDDFYEHRREGAREHVRLEGRFDPAKIIANWHTHPSYAMPEPSDQDLTVFADASEQFQHFSIIVHGGTLTVYDGEESVWEGKWAEGVEESLEEPEYPLPEVKAKAEAILMGNAKEVIASDFEFAVLIYRDKAGAIQNTAPVIGDESEVDVDQLIKSADGTPLALVHSHPEGGVEMSPWDEELGEKLTNETGEPFTVYTIAVDETGDGNDVGMSVDVCYPDGAEPGVNEDVDGVATGGPLIRIELKCGQNETCEPIEAMHAEAAEIAERHGGYVNTSESQQGADTFRDGYAYVPQNSLFAVLDEFDANPAISYDYVDIPASLKGSTFHKQLLTRYPQPGPITVTVKMGESVTEARRHAVAIMGYTDANNLRSVSIFLTQEDLDAYYNHELNHEEALGGQNIDYAYTWLYHIDSGELEGVAMARSPKEVRSAALAEIVGGLHNLRKRDPKRHVKMPRGVNEDIAPETPTPEMIAWFKQRTNRHISLVQKYAKKIADADDRFKDLPAQASTHDASKFEEPEYTPYIYVAWQYKCKKDGVPFEVPQAIKDKMNAATEHHILVNGHHPESSSGQTTGLINANDRDKPPEKLIDGTKMSDLALAEMVCDWMGMAEELGTNPHDWAKKNVNVRWKFTPEQEKLIYQLLDTVWGTGDAKDLEEAKGKKVSQQDVIDNIRATDETGESEFVATLIQDVQRRPNWELRRVNPDDYEYNWYERKDVEDYMGFMAERDDIPPVTIYDNTIMDGSHRAAAAHHLKQKLWAYISTDKVSIEEVHGEESGVQKFLRYLTYLPNKVVQGIRYYPLERVVDALRRETKAPPKVLNPQWVADLLRSGEVSGALRAPFGGKHPKWWIPQDAVRGIRELLVGRMVDVGLIDVTKYLRTESIIDPTQKTLDQDLFFQEAGEYQPKPEILEYIKKAAEAVFFKYGQPDEFFLKGSTLTFEWLPESDLDVYIVNTKIPDDQLDDAQKWMDELKQPLMQTKHVLEFYIDNQPYNKDNADTIYDLINNAWVKTPKSVHADIEEYLDEFYHVVDQLDLDTAELVRDLIDYNALRKLAGPEFKETLEKKVDEINTDVQSLIDQYENVKDARHEVFNRDMTPAEIREYGSKNLLPDNVKFKLLQRYSYLELLKALKKTMETPAGEIEDVDSHEDVAKVAKTLVQKSTSTKVL